MKKYKHTECLFKYFPIDMFKIVNYKTVSIIVAFLFLVSSLIFKHYCPITGNETYFKEYYFISNNYS